LRARCAGARMNIGWPADAKPSGQHGRGGTQFLLAVVKLLRQHPCDGILVQRRFAFRNSRSASTDHNADAVRAIAFDGGIYRRSYFTERCQCELIVAATIT